MRPVVLLAAGGLARETLAVLRRLGRPVVGVLDDEIGLHGTSLSGVGVLGPLQAVTRFGTADLVLCAGRGSARRAMTARLAALGVGPDRFTSVIDPSASIPPGCSVGPGSIVLAGSVLTADVSIGAHVVLMPRVVLTHDDVVGDFATLCAGVTLGGNVTVAEGAYLGMSSSVRQRVVIGTDSVLGMGAVLLEDLPPAQTWAGVPARPLSNRTVRDGSSSSHPHTTTGPATVPTSTESVVS